MAEQVLGSSQDSNEDMEEIIIKPDPNEVMDIEKNQHQEKEQKTTSSDANVKNDVNTKNETNIKNEMNANQHQVTVKKRGKKTANFYAPNDGKMRMFLLTELKVGIIFI